MSTRNTLPKPSAAPKKSRRELTEILTSAVMNGPATVVVTDAKGTIEYVNRKFSALTGYTPSEAIGNKASLLKSGLMPAASYQALWRHLRKGEDWSGEFHNRKKNGDTYWEQASISPVRDASGRIRHYLKIAEDITERKRLESDLQTSLQCLRAREAQLQTTCKNLEAATRALEKSQRSLRRLSQEDTLTGLLNRRGFYSELRRIKALAERQGQGIGLLMIDIDHFKKINDQHGHAAGDRILKACARLFRSSLRTSDVICRYGGDELVIALPAATAESTRLTAERLLAAVRRRTFSVNRTKIPVTVSIGAACGIPMLSQTLEHVMRLADCALYQVKRSGRNGMAMGTLDESDSAATKLPPPPATEDLTQAHACRSLFSLMLATIDAREKATGNHCKRVAGMASVLARAMKLSPHQTDLVTHGALLHDIGKIAVPDAILLKPEPLTPTERKLIQEHPQIGYDILQASPDLKALSETVLCHHERLDGSGYPRGLKGADIGLSARILAVADTYDAIRAKRPYAKPRSANEALREIERGRGTLFDPDIVDALKRCQDELESVIEADALAHLPA